ncbi:MAG: ROK family protein [Candidatus Omnitrophica bacterium]|nr:ROK family protein [Candidatus Omnitrophota bacterium]
MKRSFIIGVDLGGTNLKIGLLGSNYKIITKKVLSTRSFIKKEQLISAIINSIKALIRENRLSKKDLLGIGLGLPGPIDIKKGLVHFFPNIAGFKKVRLKRILEKRLGLPVFLDNDANLMALAEYRYGKARGFKNAVCLTLGTGVGGGIIINGILYRGSGFSAGEIGHIPLNEEGPLCNCGGRACLETYIGNKAVIKEAKKIFNRDISLEELSKLAREGDKRARLIWLRVAGRLGIALSGIINLLNPEVVVIGGGIAQAGKILFDKLRKTIKERAMMVQARQVKVLKAKLGNDAGLIGAGILVKEGSRL